jgi:hypothetical protein
MSNVPNMNNYSPYSFLDKEKTFFKNERVNIADEINHSDNLETTRQICNDLLKLSMLSKPLTINHFMNSNQTSMFCQSLNTFGSLQTKKIQHPSPFVTTFNQLSKIEELLLKSQEPVEFDNNNNEEIEVLGHKGIWLNKNESLSWKGEVPLCNYEINQDWEPDFIYKKPKSELKYVQELAIRYLRPPTPPAPGDIVITQEPNKLTSPAPPLVIRQQPARPITPEPLVIREAPPQPPPAIGRKLIIISGKRLPPPPRKVCQFFITHN